MDNPYDQGKRKKQQAGVTYSKGGSKATITIGAVGEQINGPGDVENKPLKSGWDKLKDAGKAIPTGYKATGKDKGVKTVGDMLTAIKKKNNNGGS